MRWLTIQQILIWADAYHDRTGEWPRRHSGRIAGTVCETWELVDRALREGLHGLTGGSSLAQLLAEHRGVRNIQQLPRFTIEQILAWADAHYARTGEWPTADSGLIPGTPRDTWACVDQALRLGLRSLTGGSSLAQLLAEHRGVRNRKGLPPYTVEQILAWADAHYERSGRWPTSSSGPIPDTNGETWLAVDMALRKGLRRLPGGSSLYRLLAEKRGVRRPAVDRPRLYLKDILAWIDAFHARTGQWPTAESGPIPEAPGDTWQRVDRALRRGLRGLPGGSSLARLLAAERGVRNPQGLPPYRIKQILAWADAHYERTGRWPTSDSGAIAEAPGETWANVDNALRNGLRHLPGGSSLAELLAEHRGKRHHLRLPRLSIKRIVAWAKAHFARTGAWPNINSGAIPEAPGETWANVDNALRIGLRGLTGGSSLVRLLARKLGVRNPYDLPPLTIKQILAWADAWKACTGRWPVYNSGLIPEAPGETWAAVDSALRYGKRTLPGGSSLARLLAEHRGKRHPGHLPPLAPAEVVAWARAYRQRTGRRPTKSSGAIPEAPGETWGSVDRALRQGLRSFPGGSSLAQFLQEHDPVEPKPPADGEDFPGINARAS
jgi:hypothetical protein